MNYFEFYNIPLSFHPDEAQLKEKFYALSREYHPDFHANESEEKQEEILQLSTMNNNAYKTLSNSQKRLAYILDLNGLLNEAEKQPLPQEFLMEMMDINERLMDLTFDDDEAALANLIDEVQGIEQMLLEQLAEQTKCFVEDDSKNNLLKIRDKYFRYKYLLRIKEKLPTFAARERGNVL